VWDLGYLSGRPPTFRWREMLSTHATSQSVSYEPPSIRVLGSVHALTQTQNKNFGPTDGFTFQGSPIANTS
jgi:hypothetical protein